MKLSENPRIPADLGQLQRVLTQLFRDIAVTLNQVSESRLSARYNATTAAPTAGEYAVGDFVPNSAPVEAGGVGVKYVVIGWICITASPLAFRECRVLTGN